jgi:peptidyl-prolyl cis-trans isomerase D
MSDKYNKEEPSVLQKIQNQTGCLLLIIGIAMLAFVLTDLVGSGTSIFGSNKNTVGKIAGQDVSYEEYSKKYEEYKAAVLQNNPGIQFDEFVAQQYRQQAWDFLVEEKVQNKEYEALGLDVSPAELEDLTIGKNPHQQIQQSFKDPNTGEFDQKRLERFLKEDIIQSVQAKESWVEFQSQFTKQLISEKYNALVQSSFYVTDLEARQNIKDEGLTISASVVNVGYSTYPDSTIVVTDGDIKAYVNEHKSQYEQDASRDIEFISLKVIPSAKDSAGMLEWAKENIEKFQNSQDDSSFVSNMNSESPFDPTYNVRGTFSPEIEARLFNAEDGTVLGPFHKDGVYSLFKVTGSGTDSLRSVQGSHILFRVNGNTDADTAAAIAEARELMGKIRRGETSFEKEAEIRNYDASRATGGDMGWLREGSFNYPKEVVNRLMTSGKDNMVVIKSKRGIHLAKATSQVSRKTVQVAILDQSLYASTETDGEYYRTAGEFLTKLDGSQTFEEVAESMGLIPRIATEINEDKRIVAGINNGNIVARWLFEPDTEEGDISTIMDIDEHYIVARVSKITDEGLPTVDDVRGEVEPLVRNKMIAKELIPQFKTALEKATDPDALAKELGTIVTVNPVASFTSGNFPFGQDYIIMGTVFGTPVGERSQIIEGSTGVAVVYVNNENEYDVTDVNSKKIEMTSNSFQSVRSTLSNALMEKAEVKDQRYKFYD